MNKKVFKFAVIITIILVGLLFNNKVYAAGNFTISKTDLTITEEKTATFSINGSSATGRVDIKSSDTSIATISTSSVWLENNSSTITVTGKKAGKATITITGTVADSEGEEATVTKSLSVTVKAASSGNNNGSSSSGGNNTTTTAPTFTSVNETVYATSDGINVRSSYSTSSSVLGSLKKGESLTRTGVATKSVNGILWSKVTYNGKTAYVSSAYLTKTKPAETTDKKEDDDNKTDETKSSNKNLKSLTTTPSTLSPKFSASTTEYAMTVGNDVNEIEIDAVAEDEKATVSIEGNTDLKIGENTITIKVTAEDGTVRTYKIAVTKESKNQVGLKELLIEGVTLKPEFDSSVYQYTIDLENSDISELNITATANKEKATVEIIGNTNLEVGSNIITILVTLSDDETATYQIVVNIPKPVVTENKNDNMELYKRIGIGVVGAVVLIAIIIVVVKMRKDDDDEDEDLDDEPERKYYEEEKKEGNVEKEELPKFEDEDLPKSLRKHTEEMETEKIDKKYEERSKKIDELYTMDDDLATRRKRGKHF